MKSDKFTFSTLPERTPFSLYVRRELEAIVSWIRVNLDSGVSSETTINGQRLSGNITISLPEQQTLPQSLSTTSTPLFANVTHEELAGVGDSAVGCDFAGKLKRITGGGSGGASVTVLNASVVFPLEERYVALTVTDPLILVTSSIIPFLLGGEDVVLQGISASVVSVSSGSAVIGVGTEQGATGTFNLKLFIF